MLRKKLRIPAEVLEDTRAFERSASRFFVVKWLRNGLAHGRFAVLVSSKVDQRSTERHLLKRRVSAVLGKRFSSGHDIIVSVLPAARGLSKEDFLEELRFVLEKAPPGPDIKED